MLSARAAVTRSPSKRHRFYAATACSSGTYSIRGGFSATMTPSFPSFSAFIAAAPKPSPRIDPWRWAILLAASAQNHRTRFVARQTAELPWPRYHRSPEPLNSARLTALDGHVSACGLGASATTTMAYGWTTQIFFFSASATLLDIIRNLRDQNCVRLAAIRSAGQSSRHSAP